MPAHEILSKWESFYVIVGSSAGALTGLQFVVMAIVADRPGSGGQQEIAAFGTPNVVHFMAVLLIGAIISAPWEDLGHTAIVIGLFGLTGVIYTAVVTKRASSTRRYQPVAEDWIFHVILPFASYLLLLGAALTITVVDTAALFTVATASLLLLVVGVHNAWDTVTYLALDVAADRSSASAPDAPPGTTPT
ncbi:MAG TPA: hypothetical protein VJ852_14035 [Gemmatimonadaceae bacterium]|nr:hypothetical protein [Gemmatimonadaceae bacterium]